jgi:hypothetical protein
MPLFLVVVNGLADDISWGGYLYGAGCSLAGSLIIAALYPGDGLPKGVLKGEPGEGQLAGRDFEGMQVVVVVLVVVVVAESLPALAVVIALGD